MRKEDPAPPEDEFKGGQEESGHKALDMLKFILSETKAEEKTAHEAEEKAQADYEDSMTEAKANEESLLEEIASLEKNLAEKEKERVLKKELKAADEKSKKSAEDYLASIKPGCDFMDQNIDARKDSRRAEKSALTDSMKMMEETPEYQEEAAEHGECAEDCMGEHGTDSVHCHVCKGGGTVVGFCNGCGDSCPPDCPAGF